MVDGDVGPNFVDADGVGGRVALSRHYSFCRGDNLIAGGFLGELELQASFGVVNFLLLDLCHSSIAILALLFCLASQIHSRCLAWVFETKVLEILAS